MEMIEFFRLPKSCAEVSTIWLYQNSMGNSFRDAHLLIRYMAIENYYQKNNFGFNNYNLMQRTRVLQKQIIPRFMMDNEEYFKGLIKSFEKNGFDKLFPIIVNKNLELIDGSHRLALALYFGIEKVPITITSYSKDLVSNYDITWFEKEGFYEMVELIKNKHNEIIKKQFVGLDEPTIIAEFCCNHQGSVDVAKTMVDKLNGEGFANVVKFQKRDNEYWAKHKPQVYSSNHPNKKHAFGETYKEHRDALEFDIATHKQLKQYVESKAFDYCCTVFDLNSAQEIISLKPKMIKIASCCNQFYDLLQYICTNFKGEIHLSLGMTNEITTDQIIQFFCRNNRNQDLVIYVCTSGYPVTAKDTFLLEISLLKQKYSTLIRGIGLSGHHTDIYLDVAAYVLGATYFERHYTLDKSAKGTDNALSLYASEFKELKKALISVKDAMQLRPMKGVEIEKENISKLKW